MQNSKCNIGLEIASKKVEDLETQIANLCAAKNAGIVRDHLENMETLEGHFSQTGLWKLSPPLTDPPMAKRDETGNNITAPIS